MAYYLFKVLGPNLPNCVPLQIPKDLYVLFNSLYVVLTVSIKGDPEFTPFSLVLSFHIVFIMTGHGGIMIFDGHGI
jgi:hypothetical protein